MLGDKVGEAPPKPSKRDTTNATSGLFERTLLSFLHTGGAPYTADLNTRGHALGVLLGLPNKLKLSRDKVKQGVFAAQH